jgi:ferric-dicitrate binding protein FerR (iron transport regulator)
VLAGEVVLYVDGAIAVTRLGRGRAATVRPGRVFVCHFDAQVGARLLAWLDGKLVFDGESLSEVVSEFNRYNREKMQIGDDSIAAFRIGGSYRATDPAGFARQLKAFGIGAQWVRPEGARANVIVLTKLKPAARSKPAPPARRPSPAMRASLRALGVLASAQRNVGHPVGSKSADRSVSICSESSIYVSGVLRRFI